MTTFASAVRSYEKQCLNKDFPSETVMAFVVELEFAKGMNRILNY